VPGTDIRIVSDDGKNQGPGDYGEIWAKGPQVMTGYWNKPEETALVMEDGWFKTGDIAYFSHDGFLKIVDRKKEMVIVGGMKVYPNEVENVLTQVNGVIEAGVIGVDDPKTGEAVKAYVVRENESVTIEDIMYHCRINLVAYKVPKYIEFQDELPKSNVGKILRKELCKVHEGNLQEK
jgi:long-chain acyl-CoA synthetase